MSGDQKVVQSQTQPLVTAGLSGAVVGAAVGVAAAKAPTATAASAPMKLVGVADVDVDVEMNMEKVDPHASTRIDVLDLARSFIPRGWIYVLKLVGNRYYVGKTTKDVQTRFLEHLNSAALNPPSAAAGPAAQWPTLHEPLEIAACFPMFNEHDEDNITLEWMGKYGIDKVRGGTYSTVNLADYHVKSLRDQLHTRSDACYSCGTSGHFSANCPNKGKSKNQQYANSRSGSSSSSNSSSK